MANIIRKAFPAATLAMDDEKGTIEAIVSVTGNKDRGGERVMPGFFAKSLQKKLPRGVWCHDWSMPIAKTLVAEEWAAGDGRLPEGLRQYGGYYIKGQFNLETQRGREAYSDLKFGTIDEFSIGYLIEKDKWNAEAKTKDLIEGEWFEWSPVLVGMNPETALLSVKGLDQAEAKGQYLGDYIEASMTLGACYRAMDAFYWVLIDQLYDDDKSHSERMAATAGALGELTALILKVVDAIMSGKAEESPEMAIKTVQALSLNPQDFTVALRAGLTLARHSEKALTAVKEWQTRIENVHHLRVKEGRVLSSANRATIKQTADDLSACAVRLLELYDATDPEAKGKDAEESQRLFAEFFYLDAQLSALGVYR